MLKMNLQYSLIKKVLVLQRTDVTLSLKDLVPKELTDSL